MYILYINTKIKIIKKSHFLFGILVDAHTYKEIFKNIIKSKFVSKCSDCYPWKNNHGSVQVFLQILYEILPLFLRQNFKHGEV